MRKIIFYGLLALSPLGCKEKKIPVTEQVVTEDFFSVDSLPRPIAINDKVLELVGDWQEFKEVETAFESLYRVANREDLTLVIEDLIEKQKLLEASSYPAPFDKPQITSRQRVFKTFLLKTKDNLEYRSGVKEATLKMVEAYNALRGQMNVLVNNVLDTHLLLEE